MSALEHAACIGKSDLFEGRTMQDRADAVQICASCPLATRAACRELASMSQHIVGIWDSTFHGEAGYRPRRLEPPVEGDFTHGTSSGRKAKCRCEPCLDWERTRSSKRRKDAA